MQSYGNRGKYMSKFGLRKLGFGILLFGMAVCCYTASPVKAAETDVPIDDTNFPDSTFQKYVKSNFDTDKDGSLSESERNAVKKIVVNVDPFSSQTKITSLAGIEYFPNLTVLECESNSLAGLDVTKNKKLQELNCDKNNLQSLDVSQNTELIKLQCRYNQLPGLDVTKNTNLQKLWIYENQISSIDLSKNTELVELACGNNPLKS